MRRLFLPFVLLLSLYSKAQVDRVVPKRPNPPRLVNDYTQTLTPEQVQALEQKLVAYDDSTSNQVAVVFMDNTGDYSIDEVALGILRIWGVGGKDNNNGVVLLVSKSDHKIWITVGYGLEGAIPDVTAKSIIDNDLTPNFKNGDFYRGVDGATDDIIKAAAGRYTAPANYHKKGKGFPVGLIIMIIILAIIFGSRGGRNGGMISRRGYGGFGTGWILGSMLGGGGGSSGGGWSGGGGGGGFGGFGGGGGGGGGAGGGW